MAKVAIKLPKEKLVEELSYLSFKEIKEIIDSLIQKKLFQPQTAKNLYKEASKIIKRKKLPLEVAEEAVKWSKSKK